MSTVSVGDKLENQRSLARSSPLLGKLACLVNGKNVHTVGLRKDHQHVSSATDILVSYTTIPSRTDLDTGDLVSSGEEAGVLGRPLGRGTHTVLVVLTNKDTREVPQLGLFAAKNERQRVTPMNKRNTHSHNFDPD